MATAFSDWELCQFLIQLNSFVRGASETGGLVCVDKVNKLTCDPVADLASGASKSITMHTGRSSKPLSVTSSKVAEAKRELLAKYVARTVAQDDITSSYIVTMPRIQLVQWLRIRRDQLF